MRCITFCSAQVLHTLVDTAQNMPAHLGLLRQGVPIGTVPGGLLLGGQFAYRGAGEHIVLTGKSIRGTNIFTQSVNNVLSVGVTGVFVQGGIRQVPIGEAHQRIHRSPPLSKGTVGQLLYSQNVIGVVFNG